MLCEKHSTGFHSFNHFFLSSLLVQLNPLLWALSNEIILKIVWNKRNQKNQKIYQNKYHQNRSTNRVNRYHETFTTMLLVLVVLLIINFSIYEFYHLIWFSNCLIVIIFTGMVMQMLMLMLMLMLHNIDVWCEMGLNENIV